MRADSLSKAIFFLYTVVWSGILDQLDFMVGGASLQDATKIEKQVTSKWDAGHRLLYWQPV